MNNHLIELFEDNTLVEKIKRRLPYLFQLAELESSRAGKLGMEIGSIREKIIVSLLIYKFGERNVDTEIPITEAEVDVKLFDSSISIKTITGKALNGVKLIWTVDAQNAIEFSNKYIPSCDIILVQIVWNSRGGLYYIPLETQIRIFNEMERHNYIKLPKLGTNPRGVEFTRQSLENLIADNNTRRILIEWQRIDMEFNPYKRWIDLWREN
jgi:hypothetical protein